MRLPKRIEELIRRKDEFLTASETALNVRLRKMQGMLLSKITAEIIPQLDMSNGRIRSTLKNFRILSSLDKVYNDFQNGQRVAFVEEVGGTLSGINSLTITIFRS